MDNNKYLYSVLNDKGIGQSNDVNGDKNNSNMNLINNQINNHKKNWKKASFVSRKSRHSFLDPFNQLNLKVVAEDIKHKLFEMNKNSSTKQLEIKEEEDNNKENKNEKNEKNPPLKTHKTKKPNKNKSILKNQNKDIEIKRTDKSEENKNKVEVNKSQLNETIKTKRKVKFREHNKPKKNNKYRTLTRIHNLSDSNDDDESDTEEEQYVIDPETPVIAIFDFFIIFFFVYYFFFITIKLCSEKCYCSSKKHITFSEAVIILNDITCFADFVLSFFRGFYNYNYELVKINKLILNNYFKNDFLFDLLSAIPFSQYLNICAIKKVIIIIHVLDMKYLQDLFY